MARLVFENISLEDAKIFLHWYEGQGEQQADDWFIENDSRAPLVDVCRKDGCYKVNNDEVIVYLKDKS